MTPNDVHNGRPETDHQFLPAPQQSHDVSAGQRESRWWSARRAAAYIGSGPKEIYKAVRSKKLKAVRLNGRGDIRTLREWIDEWMNQQRREDL